MYADLNSPPRKTVKGKGTVEKTPCAADVLKLRKRSDLHAGLSHTPRDMGCCCTLRNGKRQTDTTGINKSGNPELSKKLNNW